MVTFNAQRRTYFVILCLRKNLELQMSSCFVVYEKFRSLNLKEDNSLKVFEGRAWNNIRDSDTEKNKGKKEKICVKYLTG
jgi:hypothetical protein